MQSPHTESFYDWKARPANPPAASTALEGCPTYGCWPPTARICAWGPNVACRPRRCGPKP